MDPLFLQCRQSLFGTDNLIGHTTESTQGPRKTLGHYPSHLSAPPVSLHTLHAHVKGHRDNVTQAGIIPLEAQVNKITTSLQDEKHPRH
jgi:hypothetical protein